MIIGNVPFMKGLSDRDTRKEKKLSIVLFLASFIFVMYYLLKRGTMVDFYGDAYDIWQSITSFYSRERKPSYVMYKGFSSIFPYVWLYHLSQLIHINDFFFIMFYHALLFSYIAVYGAPMMIEELTNYRAKPWQKAMTTLVFFLYWERYYAVSHLSVDLPSCAFFLIAIQCGISVRKSQSWKRYSLLSLSGLFAGLCANISGQYSVAAWMIIIYVIIQIWKSRPMDQQKAVRWSQVFIQVLLVLLPMSIPKQLNIVFYNKVVAPLIAEGAWIPSGKVWMERALVNGLPNLRMFYGNVLKDARGEAILFAMFGEEGGRYVLDAAAKGGLGWSVPEYLQAFFSQPSNFVMLYLDTIMCMLSDDGGRGSILILIPGYMMEYLTLYTLVVRIKRWKNVKTDKVLLVLAVFSSVLAMLAFTYCEMRYLLTLQCLLFGTALLGPILPRITRVILSLTCRIKDKDALSDMRFPWKIVGCVAYCLFCMAYFGSLCSGSGLGINMLYHW